MRVLATKPHQRTSYHQKVLDHVDDYCQVSARQCNMKEKHIKNGDIWFGGDPYSKCKGGGRQ